MKKHRKKLILLFLCVLTNVFWIHSQDSLSISEPDFFDLERPIKYRELNEFAKFVQFKKDADSALINQGLRINYLDSVNQENQKALFQYEKFTIPSLQGLINVRDSTISNQKNKYNLEKVILNSEISKHKRKKWNFGLLGVLVGSITTLIAFVLIGV